MSARGHVHGRRAAPVHRFSFWPATRLGLVAVALAVASVVLTLSWKLMGPAGALPGLSCGFAGGVAGLAATLAVKDRAVTVAASVAPFIFAVVFVPAELTIGHS